MGKITICTHYPDGKSVPRKELLKIVGGLSVVIERLGRFEKVVTFEFGFFLGKEGVFVPKVKMILCTPDGCEILCDPNFGFPMNKRRTKFVIPPPNEIADGVWQKGVLLKFIENKVNTGYADFKERSREFEFLLDKNTK